MHRAFQQQDAFAIIGLSARVRNDDPSGIAALWSQFYRSGVSARLAGAASGDIHAVYHAYAGDQSDPYTLTIGYRVADDAACPEGLSRVSIPAQSYAVFEAVGTQPQALIAQWQTIWKSGLDRAYIADFDTYDAENKERVTVSVGVKAQ